MLCVDSHAHVPGPVLVPAILGASIRHLVLLTILLSPAREKVLDKKETSNASDVYSFGVVVWEVLSRQLPWADQSLPRDIYVRVVVHGDRPAIPAETPADIVEILLGCWAQKPEERPTFNALKDGGKIRPGVAKEFFF